MPRPAPWNAERASEIIERRARERNHRARVPAFGGRRPSDLVLLALQETFGCVPEEAVALVADALNMSRAEIHGTVTFYHDFREEPPGKRALKLCRAESCQAAGGDALARRAEEKLGRDGDELPGDVVADR